MNAPLGSADFFALEAGECLDRLETVITADDGPDASEMLRAARALRGSALMADQTPIARVAAGFEALARAVRDRGREFDAPTRELAAQTVDEARQLVRRVKEWNDGDAQRATRAATNLEAAAYLGARVSPFHCARNGRVTREGQIRIAIEMLTEIGRIAGDLGLRICQENFDSFTSEQLIRIALGTGRDNVGIQSDTGNWLILREDPVEATRACLPHTFHTHVRDYVFENETYNGVALGAGLVDFERVLPLLAQRGATGDIVFSVEVDTDDRDEDQCAHDSYAFLKDWLVRNGHTEHIAS